MLSPDHRPSRYDGRKAFVKKRKQARFNMRGPVHPVRSLGLQFARAHSSRDVAFVSLRRRFPTTRCDDRAPLSGLLARSYSSYLTSPKAIGEEAQHDRKSKRMDAWVKLLPNTDVARLIARKPALLQTQEDTAELQVLRLKSLISPLMDPDDRPQMQLYAEKIIKGWPEILQRDLKLRMKEKIDALAVLLEGADLLSILVDHPQLLGQNVAKATLPRLEIILGACSKKLNFSDIEVVALVSALPWLLTARLTRIRRLDLVLSTFSASNPAESALLRSSSDPQEVAAAEEPMEVDAEAEVAVQQAWETFCDFVGTSILANGETFNQMYGLSGDAPPVTLSRTQDSEEAHSPESGERETNREGATETLHYVGGFDSFDANWSKDFAVTNNADSPARMSNVDVANGCSSGKNAGKTMDEPVSASSEDSLHYVGGFDSFDANWSRDFVATNNPGQQGDGRTAADSPASCSFEDGAKSLREEFVSPSSIISRGRAGKQSRFPFTLSRIEVESSSKLGSQPGAGLIASRVVKKNSMSKKTQPLRNKNAVNRIINKQTQKLGRNVDKEDKWANVAWVSRDRSGKSLPLPKKLAAKKQASRSKKERSNILKQFRQL